MLRLVRPSNAIIHSFNGNPLKFLLLSRFHGVPSRSRLSRCSLQPQVSDILPYMHAVFSSSVSTTILVQARDPAKLTSEIEAAIRDGHHAEAWTLFERHLAMEGLPRKSVVNEIIVAFAETLDVRLLERAYEVFDRAVSSGKVNLLDRHPLIYLSLALAKVGSSVCASTVLRVLIKQMERYPNVDAWSGVVAFVCESVEGSCLATELVMEIGSLFRDGRVDPRKKENASLIAMKPDATAFNLTLCGCLLFNVSRKAEDLIELLDHLRVKKDAKLLVTIARVYERNGRREELKKLRRFIEESPDSSVAHLCQFYDCLLSCHLKLGDLSSASEMVLEMIRKAKEAKTSIAVVRFTVDSLNSHVCSKNSYSTEKNTRLGRSLDNEDRRILSYEEFCRDHSFNCIKTEAQSILARLLAKLNDLVEFVMTERGIIRPTEYLFVKLVKAFLESGDIKGLVDFLVKAEREDSPLSNDDSALIHVINSCIALGWLDRAHDLLDEMSLAGVRTGSAVYNSLLKAYCKAKRAKEVTALLRDAHKAGIQLNASCYEQLIQSKVIQKDTQSALDLFREMKSDKVRRSTGKEFGDLEYSVIGSSEGGGIMSKLLQEIREGEATNHGVHDWNNVIHFFCKKRLMNDAEKALKKMRSLGHSPNAQTFHSLVTGYAAIGGKYSEVTELWGEMKALSETLPMKFDQELLDSVLYTFVRGGFFARANEVVAKMEKDDMFIDKFKYRTLFLKYHKTLYKGKAPKFQTESGVRKRDAALAFKQWVGLQ